MSPGWPHGLQCRVGKFFAKVYVAVNILGFMGHMRFWSQVLYFFSCMCALQLLSRVRLFATLWAVVLWVLCPWIFQARILEWITISYSIFIFFKNVRNRRTSSCSQGLRICLPKQVWSLAGDDSIGFRATLHAPQLLNPCVTITEAQAFWSLCSATREATVMRSPCITTRE